MQRWALVYHHITDDVLSLEEFSVTESKNTRMFKSRLLD